MSVTYIALLTLHCEWKRPRESDREGHYDVVRCFQQYTFGGGPLFSKAESAARNAGWWFDDETCLCPKHSHDLPKGESDASSD